MYGGTSSNHCPNMWHFPLRATMSLHLLRFESVRLLLTCYLTECGYTSSPSTALTASTGTNYLSLRSVTYVLSTYYVHLYLCSYTCIPRVYWNNNIHCVSQVSFQCCSDLTITVVTQSRLLTDFADVSHRSLRSTKIWRTTLPSY
jgi:hypothetical protein